MTRPHSLQGRLLALILGLVVSVWLATAVITWFDVQHELGELLDGHLAQAAALLVAQQTGEIEHDDHGIDAPTLHRYAPKVAFQVFHEGRLVLRSANAPPTPMIDPQEHFQTGFKTELIDRAAWRVFAAYGAERDVQVYVGEQAASRSAILWASLRSTLWPTAVALPLLALAVWWAVRRAIAPLRRLGQTLRERKAQALHPVSAENAPAEMLPMIDALNDLFARIDTLMESERRFTADAAHELRTPLAALKLQVELAARAPDAAARADALAQLEAGADRASHLVEQLLAMARLEPEALARHFTDCDLVALAKEGLVARAVLAADKRIDAGLARAAAVRVRGDPASLSMLLANLLDNALRYTPEGGRIDVAVDDDGGHAVLSVADTGPGIAPHERERVFDRFHRGAGAGAGSGSAGSGLGLSIVKRIADAHGATVSLDSGDGARGLVVRVRFATRAEA
jgi:two-component system sensor histidine kinase QseC